MNALINIGGAVCNNCKEIAEGDFIIALLIPLLLLLVSTIIRKSKA